MNAYKFTVDTITPDGAKTGFLEMALDPKFVGEFSRFQDVASENENVAETVKNGASFVYPNCLTADGDKTDVIAVTLGLEQSFEKQELGQKEISNFDGRNR
jgi:hypothetical protein